MKFILILNIRTFFECFFHKIAFNNFGNDFLVYPADTMIKKELPSSTSINFFIVFRLFKLCHLSMEVWNFILH